MNISNEMQPLNMRLNSLIEVIFHLYRAVKIMLDHREQQNRQSLLLSGKTMTSDSKGISG